jgi:nucleotide-binding universal stress UspA family protein
MTSDFYQNIVIATDGSENNLRAISYGIKLAKLSGATVYALNVIDTYSFLKAGLPVEKQFMESLERMDRRQLLKLKSVERLQVSR